MPESNSRPNVSEGYEVPTELPGSTGPVLHIIHVVLNTTLIIHDNYGWYRIVEDTGVNGEELQATMHDSKRVLRPIELKAKNMKRFDIFSP